MSRTYAAVVITAGLLAAACSGGSTSGTASPVAGSAAPDVAALTLTAADFPAPYVFAPLPPGAAASASDALAGATFDPPACGDAAKAASLGGGKDAGIAVATDPASKSSVSATVSPVTTQLSDLDALATRCASYTVMLPATTAGGATARATVALLLPPTVDADGTRALRSTTSVSVGGRSSNLVVLSLIAQLKGLQVSVTGIPGRSGAPVDPGLLDELLVKAVQKVRAGS